MPLFEIAYTEEEIRQRVGELGQQLREDLQGKRPLLVSVLKGSVMFLADLVREMNMDPDIDFMSISSYSQGGASGVVRIVKDLEEPLEGRDVIVVEDIVDTGFTLSYLLRVLGTRNPSSLSVCTLVDKKVRRIADLEVEYSGFDSEEFLIGYGLDFRGRYRNLSYLVAVRDIEAVASDPASLEALFQNPTQAADI